MSESFSTELEVDLEGFLEEVSEEVQQEYDGLTLCDLDLYIEKGPSATAPQLNGISYRHHRMAQLIALGLPLVKVAEIIDCTVATVSRLCKDQTFRILVDSELEKLQSRDHCLQVKLQEVAEVGLDKLHEMLCDKGTELKPTVLKDITTDMLDRAGHGPSKHVQVQKSFGIESTTLERIKENARPARRLLPAIEQASAGEASDLQTPVGGTDGLPLSEAETAEGSDGPGTCLPAQIYEIT